MPEHLRQPVRPSRDRLSARPARGVLFGVLCAMCALVVGGFAWNAIQRASTTAQRVSADVLAPPEDLASVVARPHLVFLHSPWGDAYKRVAVVPLDAPDGPRYLTPLQCQRVYFRAGQGLCLGSDYVNGVATSYTAYSFNNQFQVGATFDQPGAPTRVRVSPDGGTGVMTVFATGHSYADAAFSTQTTLVDLAGGTVLSDLEKFRIERDGAAFQSADFNFWGVTFARDGDRFYATLATGGKTYLIEARVSTRQGRVLAENVECPSLSPDNTRLVFKQRTSTDSRVWHLAVMDLNSLTVSPLPGEARNIDDQVEWLDDSHILYEVQAEGTIGTDIWEAPLDGTAPPRLFVRQALSPAVVR